jgi:anti-sigma factor RsiW
MKCEVASENIVLMKYGELPDELAGVLEQHLAECESCRGELEMMQRSAARVFDTAASELFSLDRECAERARTGNAAARGGISGRELYLPVSGGA